MNNPTFLLTLFAGLSIGLMTTGCTPTAKSNDGATTTTSAASSSAASPKASAPTMSMELGNDHKDGEFTLTLKALPASIKAGKAMFMATVRHEGEVSDHANVTLKLTMPGMQMDIPAVTMKYAPDGQYHGVAEVVAGDYEAVLAADEHGAKGAATYKFKVAP